MGKIDIDFDKAEQIKSSFSELSTEVSQIVASSKGMDASIFSSYSPSTVFNNTSIHEGIADILNSIDSFGTSFSNSINLYKEAYEQSKIKVENPEETPKTEDTTLVTQIDNTELKATIDYFFGNPKGAADIRPLSESNLRNLLVANGAKEVKDNVYEMKIDGMVYQYNVSTHDIIIPNGQIKSEPQIRCVFLAKPGIDYKSITSTMTLLAGSSERTNPLGEHTKPGEEKAFGSGKLDIGDNTLVIVPSLRTGTQDATQDAPNKIGGATRIGDFMCGGSTRPITNNIVGYSMGGMGAYASVSANKGLYQNMAVVNGGPTITDNMNKDFVLKHGSYSNFNGVNLYIFEADGDKFIRSNVHLLENLDKVGVDMNQVHIYTNDKSFYDEAGKYKGIYREDFDKMRTFGKNHKGWSEHSHGYRMLEDSGIYSYLSNL